VSLDIARSLLSAGRGAGRVAVPVCADACALPFPRGCFDLVVSTECIEHTPNPHLAVREMIRVTARGGHIVMTCPNAAWHWSVRLANALRVRPYLGYENWPAFAELRGWFEAGGTTVAEHVGFHALPFQLPLPHRWLPVLDRIVLTHAPAMGINQLLVATVPS
jgi:2-polyprenyl-6-hydroxyphenyl methylase/3-demethylubiquinone-9 3-methyltransferase